MNKTKMAILTLCALSAFSLMGCGGKTTADNLIPDEKPYRWANVPTPQAQPDDGVVIDGNFDDAIWQNITWLDAVDTPDVGKNSNIKVGTVITEKGLYLAFDVEESGSNIWVNPERASYCNSCIELYMDAADAEAMTKKTVEFDLMADGTYSLRSRVGSNSDWKSARYKNGESPVTACATKGGSVNERTCYGYSYEVFMPKEYLEYLGYEFSTDIEFALNPVHIVSLDYNSTDDSIARLYSQWIGKYAYGYNWGIPKTWLAFGKDGLVGYKINISQTGESSLGMVSGLGGTNVINKGHTGKLEVICLNGGKLKILTVDGKNVTDKVAWQGDYGTFDLGKPTADVNVSVAFGK